MDIMKAIDYLYEHGIIPDDERKQLQWEVARVVARAIAIEVTVPILEQIGFGVVDVYIVAHDGDGKEYVYPEIPEPDRYG